MKLEKWLSIDKCSDYDCRSRRVTHVIFLNAPGDEPYVVGACSRHKQEADFSYTTLRKFNRVLEGLRAQGVASTDLPYAIAEHFDPEIGNES